MGLCAVCSLQRVGSLFGSVRFVGEARLQRAFGAIERWVSEELGFRGSFGRLVSVRRWEGIWVAQSGSEAMDIATRYAVS